MSNMLASDLANPEFVNPINPDNTLGVKFYSKPLQDNFRSEVEGRPIFNDVDMVRITSPGDALSIIDTIATEHYKNRFRRQWQFYQANKEGDQLTAGRTPLTAWSRLTPSQVEELKYLKFYSVEDIANASDAALHNIGMVGGMGGHAFRQAAQAYLNVSRDAAAVQHAQQENAALRAEMNELRQQMQGFAALAAQTSVEVPAPDAAPVPEVRRGRPPNAAKES